MSTRNRMWTGVMLVLALTQTSSAWAQEKAAPKGSDAALRAAIESVNTKFADAMKAGDATALAGLYTDDAQLLAPNTPQLQGRAAIAKVFGEWFTQMKITDFKLSAADLIPAGDYAVETGAYAMTMQLKGETAPVTDKGKYIVVWKRGADGSWKLHRDVWNSDLPVPGAK